MAKQRAWRLIALMISCTGLTASVLACSPAQADSAATAAATIRCLVRRPRSVVGCVVTSQVSRFWT